MTKEGLPQGMKGILGWVLGVAIIAFILLIMVIIFGNLQGNVGFTSDSSAFTNETINLTDTPSTPTGAANRVNGVLSDVLVHNSSGGEVVVAANYTVSGVTLTTATDGSYNGTLVGVNYTVTYDSQGQRDADNIIFNYTSSALNTTEQLPTVGTIIGIAILLLILIGLLVFAIMKMMGVAGATGGRASTGKGFSGGSREFS